MALHFESSSPQIFNNSLKTVIFALKKEPTVEDGSKTKVVDDIVGLLKKCKKVLKNSQNNWFT